MKLNQRFEGSHLDGFTLIELITVIIILGILASVVSSKYFEIAAEAERTTNQQSLAEAVVQFNLAYMKYAVDHGTAPENLEAMTGQEYLDLDGSSQVVAGDYRFTYTSSDTGVLVSVERSTQSGGWDTVASRTIDWP